VDLRLICDGVRFTLYALEMGESVADMMKNLERDNADEHARMLRRLGQLAERGASRRKDEFNDLEQGLFEAKTKGGTRVIFFYDAGAIVICACGFHKQSRKTPRQVLAVARERKKYYDAARECDEPIRIFKDANQKQPQRVPQ